MTPGQSSATNTRTNTSAPQVMTQRNNEHDQAAV